MAENNLCQLTREVQRKTFTALECHLYLNTHPDCQEAAAAFAKIGVDADAAATGISSKANQAFADWAAASAAARDAGIDDTRLIRAGFEQMMGKLESRAEFEAF